MLSELEISRVREPAGPARRVVAELLGRRLGCLPEEIEFGREQCPCCGSQRGRPSVVHPRNEVHFSLARSGQWLLVAIAPVPVGIDVESLASAETVVEVTPLLHPSEQREIAASPDRREAFTRVWTRKEAYLKGLGTGIAHGIDAQPDSDWTIVDVPVAEGYAAAVALSARSATAPSRSSAARSSSGSIRTRRGVTRSLTASSDAARRPWRAASA